MNTHQRFPPESDAGGNSAWSEIGARLIHVRGNQSQSSFAKSIGLHKNTLGNYERGDREIGGSALAALVALGWDANWLLTGQGQPRQDAPQTRATPSFEAADTIDDASLALAIGLALAHEQEQGHNYTLDELATEVARNYRQLRTTIRGVPVGSALHKAIRAGKPPETD